ncbi:MAG: TonB family protein [Phocaeicola massiliensis]|nr:TonB family protein [Phocaeicola massiliensis]
MRSCIVFLIAICLLSTGCIKRRQKTETKEYSTLPMDTSLVVVDSTILLYSNVKTSGKEIHAILKERPEYPGGMDEVVKYIQTHIQYPLTAISKRIQGRVWIESVIDRIRMMPDWKPGKLNGETVKVKYVFPVTFRLEDHMVLVDEGPKRNPNDTGAVEIEYIPPVNFDSVIKKSPSVKWGLLVDDTEGVIKIHLDDWTHKEIKSKSKDVRIISSSLSNDKVYVSIFSTSHYLTYKGEYIFYREDKQKRLHEIYCKNIDKESVALQVERGKEAEIGIDLPKNAQPGDYLLKIRVYDENETCFYNIYQWFEAYTSQQVSTRERPIPVGPANCKKVFPDEEGVFDVVQHMPEFPGGMLQLMEFIRQNIQYPQAAKQNKLEGTVIMQVVIDKDGTVTQPRILCSVNPVLSADAALCEEALRIVSIMPKWKPGHQHGVNLKVKYTFPIKFEIPVN